MGEDSEKDSRFWEILRSSDSDSKCRNTGRKTGIWPTLLLANKF